MSAPESAQSASMSFNDLPSNILTLIAEHMRASSTASAEPKKPFPTCRCGEKIYLHNTQFEWTAQRDAALAFSGVSKRVRGVVFDQRVERSVSIGFCDQSVELCKMIPEEIRGNVTTLSIEASQRHAPSRQALHLADVILLFPGIRSLDLRFEMGSVKEYLLPYQKHLSPTPVNLQYLRLYIDDFKDLEDEYYGEQAKNLLRCLGGQNVEKLSLILDLHDCELGMDVDEDFGREPNWRKWTLAFGKDALPRLTTIKFEFAVDISEPVHERSLWDDFEQFSLDFTQDSSIKAFEVVTRYSF